VLLGPLPFCPLLLLLPLFSAGLVLV
jgi:hypothetical protein